jgi:cysteine desulfurase/selenocysteine lyase
MSTIEPSGGAAGAPLPASPSQQYGGAPPSVPDPATIALLANTFFKAFPGQPVEPTGLTPAGAAREPNSPGVLSPDVAASTPLSVAASSLNTDPGLVSVAPSHVAAQAGSPPYAPVSPAFAASPGLPSIGQPAAIPNIALPTAASTVFAGPHAFGSPSGVPAGAIPSGGTAPTLPSGYGGQSPDGAPNEADLAALPYALEDSTSLRAPSHGGSGYAAPDAAVPGEGLYFLNGLDAPGGKATSAPQGAPHPGATPLSVPAAPPRPAAPHSPPIPGAAPAPAFSGVAAPAAVPALAPLDFAALPFGLGDATSFVPAAPAIPDEAFYFLGQSAAPPAVPAAIPAAASPVPAAAPTGVHAIHPTAHELNPELGPTIGVGARPFDAGSIRRDFPILRQHVHGRPLIWLDNAATTQKPQAVIDRLSAFYENENSNIHRGAHTLAARATDAYEAAREKTRRFINASSANEIVFVRGATEGINLIAKAYGGRHVQKGDEILITWLEHHANIVPWQMLCAETGAALKVAPVDDKGQIRLDEYEKLLSRRTRIVSFSMVANAIGTVTPAKDMIEMAHRLGACVVADGAQAVSHMPVDVQALDCDFFVFSGHKVFGPTGIGVVYGKPAALEAMPPWQGGGNMIVDVTFEKTIYHGPPGRFEAGTGNIADAVGLGAAFDYLEAIGMSNVAAYEHELLIYMTEGLKSVPGLRIIGCADEKAGVVSLVLDGCRSEDVGAALDREGIAVRAGHHCAQPILRRLGHETTVRPSLALYNTRDDIDALVAALRRISTSERFRSR